jgi:hypothetical protein
MPYNVRPAATTSFAVERLTRAQEDSGQVRLVDKQLDAMCAAFHTTGGLARGDDLALLLEDHRRGADASLSKLIASDRVFGFKRSFAFWVPMFQFELDDLRLKPAALKVRAELAAEFDGWEVASWFAEPNAWLRDQRPVEMLDSNLREVMAAARIDRFIAAR